MRIRIRVWVRVRVRVRVRGSDEAIVHDTSYMRMDELGVWIIRLDDLYCRGS